jgi:hypothetical protein
MDPQVFPLTVMSVPSVSWHVMGTVVGGTVVSIVVVCGVDVVVALAKKVAIIRVHNSTIPPDEYILDFILVHLLFIYSKY